MVKKIELSNDYAGFLSLLKRSPDLDAYTMGLDDVHEWRSNEQKKVQTVMKQLKMKLPCDYGHFVALGTCASCQTTYDGVIDRK